MKKEEKILTLHPQGKKGVNILKRRYDMIADYMLNRLRKEGELIAMEMAEEAEQDLAHKFDGKVMWYMISVKLDLEARKLIERVPKTSPHKIRLKK